MIPQFITIPLDQDPLEASSSDLNWEMSTSAINALCDDSEESHESHYTNHSHHLDCSAQQRWQATFSCSCNHHNDENLPSQQPSLKRSKSVSARRGEQEEEDTSPIPLSSMRSTDSPPRLPGRRRKAPLRRCKSSQPPRYPQRPSLMD
ncbi:expressed unknown protein [Seminavis robusta]|uniref:Uncharacterized protein n=1 Tax=Seminavis robusta TaxID=568900 RepID=A0A9N8E756_9STRA|nr:expressed unknown protein [Seminavis robusta]|eukprot:Sro617_g176070.1 n/a (148) ;mRNA; f:15618-16061